MAGLARRTTGAENRFGRRIDGGLALAMRGGDRCAATGAMHVSRRERGRLQSAGDRRALCAGGQGVSQRVILLTGANGGLGTAIARSFLEASADNFVYLGVRKRRDRAEKLVENFAGQ